MASNNPVLTVSSNVEGLGFDPGRLERISEHFRHYVDDGRLPGWSLSVGRRGEVAYLDHYGHTDVEAGTPVADDTIFRIFSMTKPITSVATMMLVERGKVALTDPVSKYIPAFAKQRVFVSGSSTNPNTEGLLHQMKVWHLLTHTAGLTYGFMHAHPVDAMYRSAGYEWGVPPGTDLEAACELWASQPLLFQPGTEWNYSVATDVLGRVVEVASGRSLDEFFRTEIFEPLGMVDTGFWADTPEKQERVARLYTRNPADGGLLPIDAMGRGATNEPTFLSGGGGTVSTVHDYHRFTEMLRRRGELDGVRLLGSRTIDYMTTNHLPDGKDLIEVGRPLFSETEFEGTGFGLGFSVTLDAAAGKVLGSDREFNWGGAASTAFWVDPIEDITVTFMTQLLPSSTYPIRPELKTLVYQALVD